MSTNSLDPIWNNIQLSTNYREPSNSSVFMSNNYTTVIVDLWTWKEEKGGSIVDIKIKIRDINRFLTWRKINRIAPHHLLLDSTIGKVRDKLLGLKVPPPYIDETIEKYKKLAPLCSL